MSRADFTYDWVKATSAPINYSVFFNESVLWWFKSKGSGEAGGHASLWVPILAGVLSFVAILGNALVMLTFLGWSKLRTGQNVMLVNVSVSDILYVFFTVPSAILSYLGYNNGVSTLQKNTASVSLLNSSVLCRVVHYVLSVCLYVAIYSPVAACVFRFLVELMRRNGSSTNRRKKNGRNRFLSSSTSTTAASRARNQPSGEPPATGGGLTACHAGISCVVIWLAFLLANVNVLLGDGFETNVAAVVGLHQPSFCNDYYASALQQRQLQQQRQQEQSMSLQSLIYKQHLNQPQVPPPRPQQLAVDSRDPATMMRSLWLIFLISAFLVPLAVISLLSGILLFWIQCRQTPNRNPITNVISAQESSLVTTRMASPICHSPPPSGYASLTATTGSAAADHVNNASATKRDAVVLIMAVSVARSLCWLPVQICLLVDVFGLSRDERVSSLHHKAEIFGVCFALLGCAINPIIFYCSVPVYRRAVFKLSRRICQKEKKSQLTLERISSARSQSNRVCQKSACFDYGCGSPAKKNGSSGARIIGTGMNRPGTMRRKESDANETILSIISDSSNRINYA